MLCRCVGVVSLCWPMLTLPQVADKHLLIMTCGDGRGSVCVCVEDSTSIFTLFDIVECGSQQV